MNVIAFNVSIMKIIQFKRETKNEKYYASKMGMINVPVTTIKKYIFGLPVKTLHKYRETYYGKIKNCEDCNLYA